MKYGFCLRCKNKFSYFDTQKDGKFCSRQCYGDFSIESRLIKNSIYDKSIRGWCYRNLEQKCYICGFSGMWNNKFLRLQVDHKDGNVCNNQRNNLNMICPNCHTQTETWGSKNVSDEGRLKMITGAATMREFQSK